jgi:Cu(I)/Ag(I) efflux system membrane fusion protein
MDLLDPYLKFKDALVETNTKKASREAQTFLHNLKKIDMSLLDQSAHELWMPIYQNMKQAVEKAFAANDIEIQRQSFSAITDSYFEAINTFGLSGLDSYYQYCSMAFDNKGAYWISKDKDIKNPYFGSKMMTCGETIQKLK